MNTKKEILKKVADGILTVDEGLRLLDQVEATEYEQDAAELVVEKMFEEFEDDNGIDTPVFEYDKVLDIYDRLDWKWYDTPNGIKLADLKDCVLSMAQDVVAGMQEQRDKGEKIDFVCATAGLEMNGYYNESTDKYIFTLKFVPVEGEIELEINEL